MYVLVKVNHNNVHTLPRAIAANCLHQVIYQGRSLTEVLKSEAIRRLEEPDRALVKDICFGSLRWHYILTTILEKLMAKPLKKKDKDVECLIRVGLYQLYYQQTAKHAAVNETVKASKSLKKNWSKSLINGVLRNFIRDQAKIEKNIKPHTAFPYWLIKRIKQAWPEEWKDVLVASNQRAPMTLRVNATKTTVNQYIKKLADKDIEAYPHSLVYSAIELKQAVNVHMLPNFEQGFVSVQDASAQLAAKLLDCKEGMRVLDACAAPGGKTGHIAESSKNLQITAIDTVSHRLSLVQDNLLRLGEKATLIKADAGDLASWHKGQLFDRILLDAPCSALGVMRRHPDIKVLRQETDIAPLVELQKQLLDALWTILKPGGKLLYATCSILPEENDQQIERFVTAHSKTVKVHTIEGKWGRAGQYGRQILPNKDNMDGFYYSLLEKK